MALISDDAPWVVGIVQDLVESIHAAHPDVDFTLSPPPNHPVVVAFRHLFHRQNCEEQGISTTGPSTRNDDNNGAKNDTNSTGPNGALIGGIVAGVVVLLILVGAFFLYRRRTRNKSQQPLQQQQNPPYNGQLPQNMVMVQPFNPDPNTPPVAPVAAYPSHPKYPQPVTYNENAPYVAPPSTNPPSSVTGDTHSFYNPAPAPNNPNPVWAHSGPHSTPSPHNTDNASSYYGQTPLQPSHAPPMGQPWATPSSASSPYGQPQPLWAGPHMDNSTPTTMSEKAMFSGYHPPPASSSSSGGGHNTSVPAWATDFKHPSGAPPPPIPTASNGAGGSSTPNLDPPQRPPTTDPFAPADPSRPAEAAPPAYTF